MDKSEDEKHPQKPEPPIRSEVAAQDPRKGAKDRPGFDLGGAVGDKTAGTGLGLGENAAEDPRARSLPGRR